MTLEEILRQTAQHLRSLRLQSEEHTKLAAILPILRALGWDDTNPGEFVPEHPVGNGRVDYALFNPQNGLPLVFIEAKRPGNASEQGEDQLFAYAANQGVPFLILTDGDIWNFYLSMAAGRPSDRKFYQLSVQRCDEHDKDDRTAECARFLREYLERERVISQNALRDAHDFHENAQEKRRARNALPEVWRTLLEKSDENLCSLVADAVGAEKGIRPELDDVKEFLKRQVSASARDTDRLKHRPSNSGSQQNTGQSASGNGEKNRTLKRIIGYTLDGNTVQTRNSTQTLAEILKAFQGQDPAFMDDFYERTKGKSRRLVARSREELYDRAHLMKYSVPLQDGWWLGVNISTVQVEKYVQIAGEVRGLSVKLIWN